MTQELYKKHRPRVWEDLIGQDNVVRTFVSALENNRIPTGYLFAGSPGSGKTSSAFILAKALNCENRDPVTQNPCLECRTCKAIDANSMPGVNYIAMANRGGVDEVRQMVESTKIAQPVKKKVWICDEVQNLSNQAFDSLLIPLEEENSNTLFILCTTEPEKVRPAVRSRLQIRNFAPLSKKDIASLLIKTLLAEGKSREEIKVMQQAIVDIADASEGRARDALVLLDSFLVDGTIPSSNEDKILSTITHGSLIDVFNLIDELSKTDIDYPLSTEKLYKRLVDMVCGRSKGDVDNDFYKVMGVDNLYKAIDILASVLKNMSSRVIGAKTLFEIAISEIARLKK